jgi:ubiquinone/menaquinone biosynthesis C-methylase UbiE
MAQANAIKAGVADRVSFEMGNAAKLRFEESSYDMLISTGMLHALKDPVKMLGECHRVLKPGGEAWIYDPARVASKIDREKWKASLTFRERFIYMLLVLFRAVAPPPTYDRKQITEMIALTHFGEYRIEKEDDEIQIRLRK